MPQCKKRSIAGGIIMELSLELRRMLVDLGASLIGFADLRQLSSKCRKGMEYGISIGIGLNPLIITGIENGQTYEYFEEYKRVNNLLDTLALKAGNFLENAGHKAIFRTATEVVADSTYSTDLPHKTVATRAGLGWIGKCALLVTPEFGSAVRITTVLTDAHLEVGVPINEARCGNCNQCVISCPGNASSGENWSISKHRDEFFNASECRKTARQKAARIGIDSTICGKCIEVCPWTKKYVKSSNKVI